MTRASGRSSSEPAKPKSIGRRPRIAAPEFISLGQTRPTEASRKATSKGSPAAIKSTDALGGEAYLTFCSAGVVCRQILT